MEKEGFIFDHNVMSMRTIRLYPTNKRIAIRYGICKLLEKSPCYCCGSPGHSVMTESRTRGGVLGREYVCPILNHEELYPPGGEWVYINFYPCPIKVATKNHYDMELVQTDWNRMNWRGIGYFMSSYEKDLFREEMRKLCWDFRYGHTFTREIRSDALIIDGDDEGEDSDDGERC